MKRFLKKRCQGKEGISRHRLKFQIYGGILFLGIDSLYEWSNELGMESVLVLGKLGSSLPSQVALCTSKSRKGLLLFLTIHNVVCFLSFFLPEPICIYIPFMPFISVKNSQGSFLLIFVSSQCWVLHFAHGRLSVFVEY